MTLPINQSQTNTEFAALLFVAAWLLGGTDCDGLVVVIDALELVYVVNCIIFGQKRHV